MPLFTLTSDEYATLYPSIGVAKFVLTSLTKVFDIFGTSTISLNYDIEINEDSYKIKTCATLFRLFTLKCQEFAIVPAYPELYTYDSAAEYFADVKEYFDLGFHFAIESEKCVPLIEILLTNDQGNQADKLALKSQYKDKLLSAAKKGARLFSGLVRQKVLDDQQLSDPPVFEQVKTEYEQTIRDIHLLEYFRKHDKETLLQFSSQQESASVVQNFFSRELSRRADIQKRIEGGILTYLGVFRDTIGILLSKISMASEIKKEAQEEADETEQGTLIEHFREMCQQIEEGWLTILEFKLAVDQREAEFDEWPEDKDAE